MEKMTEQDGASLDIVNENLEALKKIFPDAFTEDGVDFDVLRQLLGDEVIDGEEKYGLNWHGKKNARQIALTPSIGTLRPCPEESADWDTTQNLFIEGDNLEVLKLLQKSYAGKVKMIYIDPPYNTGKEFIYPDKFQDNLDTYLKYTGQKDDDGFKLTSNTESSGRFHTNWLNMMYPRLKLARNLLSHDGLIFISIDDHEIDNLKNISSEIFGGKNFIGTIVWQSKKGGGADNPFLVTDHEYVICFAKSITETTIGKIELEAEPLDKEDEQGRYRKGRELNKWGSNSRREDRPTMFFAIPGPNNEDVYPIKNDGTEGCWRWGKKKMFDIVAQGNVEFERREDGTYIVYEKIRSQYNREKPFRTWVTDVGTTADGSKVVKGLFDGEKIFDFPKPLNLIEFLIEIGVPTGGIVLDFFAGSSTMCHASFEHNKKNNSKATSFISVQLPEQCEENTEAFKAGYKTIADIGKERIRRAAAKNREENPMFSGDLGFKVFKLDTSNIRVWNPDRDNLEQTLFDHTEHLIEGRSEEDVLYELLLKRGVELAVPIEEKQIAGKTVYSIGYGVLFACLDTKITRDDVEPLARGITQWHQELEPATDTQVVFRDSAFADDIAKTNMTAILEQNGIAYVRSL